MWFVHVQKATPVQLWKFSAQLVTKSWPEYYIIHFKGYPLKCFKQKPANIFLNKSNLTSIIFMIFMVTFDNKAPNPFLSAPYPHPPPQNRWEISHGLPKRERWLHWTPGSFTSDARTDLRQIHPFCRESRWWGWTLKWVGKTPTTIGCFPTKDS